MTPCLVTTMSSDSNSSVGTPDLTDFVTRFFSANDAVMEKREKGIHVLLPEETAAALDVGEEIFLAQDPDDPHLNNEKECHAIQFQTPLLDGIVSMAGDAPPFLQAGLTFTYIKTQGFEKLINEQFTFYKSKIKKISTADTITRYLILTCRYLAQSDEQKQGLIDFAVNLETMSLIPDMPKMMGNAEKQYAFEKISGFSHQKIRTIHSIVESLGPSAVEEELEPFKKSMNRRYKRDSASLDTYYKALEEEMAESLERSGISEKVVREREAKIAMLPQELAAKKKDLLNKYTIKLNFSPAAALLVTTPCVRVSVTLISGRTTKTLPVIYNPVTKQMDPLVCTSCGTSTYAAGLTDTLDLCCPDCL